METETWIHLCSITGFCQGTEVWSNFLVAQLKLTERGKEVIWWALLVGPLQGGPVLISRLTACMPSVTGPPTSREDLKGIWCPRIWSWKVLIFFKRKEREKKNTYWILSTLATFMSPGVILWPHLSRCKEVEKCPLLLHRKHLDIYTSSVTRNSQHLIIQYIG